MLLKSIKCKTKYRVRCFLVAYYNNQSGTVRSVKVENQVICYIFLDNI